MLKTETFVYESTLPFNELGTNDVTSQDTLQRISNILLKTDFSIKEEEIGCKVNLFINTQNKASIDLWQYTKKNEENKDSVHQTNLNKMKNRIQDLMHTISMQDQKINELKQREDNHIKLINKIEQITNNMNDQLDREQNNNNNNKNSNFNNYNSVNPYQTNNNSYNPYNNNNNDSQYKMNNNTNVKISVKTVYSPYMPDNTNFDNLLTRPEYRNNKPRYKHEKKKTINLDNIENYRP